MFWTPDAFLSDLIEEDLHLVDLTSLALGLEGRRGTVTAAPKETGVVAGLEAARRMFELAGCHVLAKAKSGQMIQAGAPALTAAGQADRLHGVYKAAQSVMEFSSGIAARCRLMVERARAASPGVEILVTRKHAPGTKRLSLAAALAGGASIHRTGLSDSLLVFDQHRVFIGGLAGLVKMIGEIRRRFPEKKLAAETGSIEEAVRLAQAGLDVVQLERLGEIELSQAVLAIRGARPEAIIVAAGGINADNAAAMAATGVDGLVTSWPYHGPPRDVKMAFAADQPTLWA